MTPRITQTRRHGSQICNAAPAMSCITLAVALLLGAGAWQPVQAVDVGHARILSGAGQPLRLVVPLTGLSPDEAATLAVRLADAAAWRQSGLTPPAALADLGVTVQPGANASRRNLIVTAVDAPRGDVVDMLLELETSAGQRRIQVSFVVPAQAAPGMADIQPPRVGTAPTVRAVIVRRGDTLSGIAQTHRYAGVSLYQMLAALYQANPQAFIQQNMNLVKAGSSLAIPDADTVRAVDPAEARRLFLAHGAAFARYRAGMAETAGVAAGGSPESGRLEAPPAATPEQPASAGDRLRLSSDTPTASADQAADEHVALARAEQDVVARVAQLERNVSDIHQALAAPDIQTVSAAADGSLDQGGQPQTQTSTLPTVAAVADSSLADSLLVQNPAGAPTPAVAETEAFVPPVAMAGSSPSQPATSSSTPSLPVPASAVPDAGRQADEDGTRQPDNLLVWITGLLAILALIIAWVMRRGGRGSERRDEGGERGDLDEQGDDDAPAEPGDALRAQFTRRLESIDLDLSNSPADSGHWSRR